MQKMGEIWERFAREDAQYYIATNASSEEMFWEQGEKNVEQFVAPLTQNYGMGTAVVVDFGCGIGRHSFPLARIFAQVVGVDVSPTMVHRAREMAQARGVANARFVTLGSFFSEELLADFVYCAHVFQHIESWAEIEDLLRNLRKKMRGYGYFHFDTRPPSLLQRVRLALPDWALPRSYRRGIRRIRRSPEEVRQLFQEIRLEIFEEHQPSSEYHFFLVREMK